MRIPPQAQRKQRQIGKDEHQASKPESGDANAMRTNSQQWHGVRCATSSMDSAATERLAYEGAPHSLNDDTHGGHAGEQREANKSSPPFQNRRRRSSPTPTAAAPNDHCGDATKRGTRNVLLRRHGHDGRRTKVKSRSAAANGSRGGEKGKDSRADRSSGPHDSRKRAEAATGSNRATPAMKPLTLGNPPAAARPHRSPQRGRRRGGKMTRMASVPGE